MVLVRCSRRVARPPTNGQPGAAPELFPGLVLSITRYRQGNGRSPTWAEALAGVDPALWEPITTVPDGWPLAPAVWRRELRQRLMGELKQTRWVTYTRTPRSLQPGDVGRGWLSTVNPPPDGQPPPDTTR